MKNLSLIKIITAFILGFYVALMVVIHTLSINMVLNNGETIDALVSINIMGNVYDYYYEK